jgi:NAD(P)H-hydrate epimerase
MRILTAAQMREADRLTTERHGVTSLQLMGNAGSGVVAFLQKEYADLPRRRIVVLCGKGNNGGDGFVVARMLFQLGAKPAVFLFAQPERVQGDAAFNLERWRHVGGALTTVTEIAEWKDWMDNVLGAHEIVVDALLGTGLSGPVEGLLAYVIQSINEHGVQARHRSRVLAVDMPSGLPSDDTPATWPVIRADWTVTFTAPKIGQLLSPSCESVGRLVVHSIGTPRSLVEQLAGGGPDLRWLEPGEFRGLPLRRRADTNKGTYGHALIVAGSRGKAGAAALAGWGALRSGAGLVTVATPEDALPVVASFLPELMTVPLQQTKVGTVSLINFQKNSFAKLVEGKSVLGIGPGLTMQEESQKFVRQALAECPLPIVLDADGLNALAAAKKPILKRRSPALVLTPHPGEMARLLGVPTEEIQADRLGSAQRAAEKYQAFIVLKGFHTIIATPLGRAFINSTGNPGMATAGTGDVLTGILAGLTAQFGIDDWERIIGLGVYLHGLAGDIASARVGEAPLIASDLIGAIPEAFKKLTAELEDGA